MKRLLLLAALCLLLLPLPQLLALAPAREAAFSWLGQRLAGELSAESCSFGWFSGLRCKGFAYRNQRLPVTAEGDLQGGKGLLMLLLAPRSLGDIGLDNAVVTLRTGRESGRNRRAVAIAAAQERGDAPAGQSKLVRWWNNNGFRLKLEHSLIRLEHGDRLHTLASDVAIDALLENGSLRYTLTGRSDGAADNLRAEGYLNAPPENSGGGAALLGTGTIILDESPVAALPSLPWLPKAPAGMEGRIGGSCRVLLDVDGTLRIEGAVMGSNLILPGLTAKDQPAPLGRASLLFDARTSGEGGLQVERFNLESDAAKLNLHGLLRPNDSAFEADAALSLPFFAEALRGVLGLRDDARITAGELRCDLNARGPIGRLPLRMNCAQGDIEAMRADEAIRWRTPLVFSTVGRLENGGFVPEHAEVRGALARFEAGPDEDGTFVCRGEADLDALSREAARVAALPWQGGGTLRLSLRREPDAGERRTGFDCEVDGFFLNREGADLLPPHGLKLTGALTERGGEIRAAELRGEAWPGSFELDIPALRRTPAGMQADYRLAASLLPARTQLLLRRFRPDWSAFSMDGSARLDLTARLRNGQGAFPALLLDARHEIAEARIELARPDFKWRAGDAELAFSARTAVLAVGGAAAGKKGRGASPASPGPPSPLRLEHRANAEPAAGVSFIAPARRELALTPLALDSDAVALEGDVAFTGGKNPAHALHLRGELDGGVLENLLRSIGLMPTGARARGPAHIALRAETPKASPAETEIAARLDRLIFGREKKTLWEQRNLNLYARFTAAADAASASWNLPEFSAQSPDFWANGKGFLLNRNRGGSMLALDGRYLAGANPKKEPAPFQLSVPLQ